MIDRNAHEIEERTGSRGAILPCELCDSWFPMGGFHFMTRREVENLDRMRQLKAKVRALKEASNRKAGTETGPGADRLNQLERLRALWKELEAERTAAAEERMRILGHSDG